jgi:hypothetical protein
VVSSLTFTIECLTQKDREKWMEWHLLDNYDEREENDMREREREREWEWERGRSRRNDMERQRERERERERELHSLRGQTERPTLGK